MVTPYTNIKSKKDVARMLDNNGNDFVIALCDNISFAMAKIIDFDKEKTFSFNRDAAPIIGLYVKILTFWKQCVEQFKQGNLGIYIAYGRILFEAFVRMVYLINNGDDMCYFYRIASYKNRYKAYKETKDSKEGVDIVRNNKFLYDIKQEGFTIKELEEKMSNVNKNLKTFKDELNDMSNSYLKEKDDLMYNLLYGYSSDAIHSSWGELRQLYLTTDGVGNYFPKIEGEGKEVYHYRVIIPYAKIVTHAIKAFLTYYATKMELKPLQKVITLLIDDIERVIDLTYEKIKDDYNSYPNNFFLN